MTRWAELTSFLIGAAAALVLLAGWRVPGGDGELGADLTLSIGRSPSLQLSQTGTVVDAGRLRPGRTLRTAVVVHNPGRETLRLQPRSQVATGSALARLLHVEVRAGGAPLYAGTFAGLERSARPFWLQPDASRQVTIGIGLPRAVDDGYRGRSIQASVVFEAAS